MGLQVRHCKVFPLVVWQTVEDKPIFGSAGQLSKISQGMSSFYVLNPGSDPGGPKVAVPAGAGARLLSQIASSAGKPTTVEM